MIAKEIKKGVLNAFLGMLPELNLNDLENVQDRLIIQLHNLTDSGERTSLDDLKKEVNIK
jgi:hypothetical protein